MKEQTSQDKGSKRAPKGIFATLRERAKVTEGHVKQIETWIEQGELHSTDLEALAEYAEKEE